MFTKEAIELAKPVYEVLKKLGWEWTPERGEFAQIGQGRIVLVETDDYYENTFVQTCAMGLIPKDKLIPILYWEKIEEILRQKYMIGIRDIYNTRKSRKYKCIIAKRDASINSEQGESNGETRQIAVIKAVIKLGESICE